MGDPARGYTAEICVVFVEEAFTAREISRLNQPALVTDQHSKGQVCLGSGKAVDRQICVRRRRRTEIDEIERKCAVAMSAPHKPIPSKLELAWSRASRRERSAISIGHVIPIAASRASMPSSASAT